MARGLGAFGTLALGFVMARCAGAAQLGLFMIGLSMIVGLGIVARFGMDNAMLRFGAIAVHEKNLSLFRGLQRQAFFLSLALSMLLSGGLLFFRNVIAQDIFASSQLAEVLVPMALVLPAYSLIYMQGTWLKVLGRPQYAPVFETGAVAFLTSLIIFLTDALGDPVSASDAGYCLLIATVLILLFGQIVVRSVKQKKLGEAGPACRVVYQQGLFSVLPDFVLIAMTAYAVQWGALLILGAYGSDQQVGIYSTAHRLAFIVNFILMVFNSVLAPKFAAMYAAGRHAELNGLVKKSTLYMTIFSLPVSLLLFIFADFWLSFFGDEFVMAAPILMILVVAQFVNVATGSVGFLLNMTGHQRHMRNIVLMTGAITVGLSLYLIPLFGIWGALISNATALVLQNLVAAWYVKRLIGIRTIPGWDWLHDFLANAQKSKP